MYSRFYTDRNKMQLQMQEQREQKTPKDKSIYLIENGQPAKLFVHVFRRSLSKDEITRAVQKMWGLGRYRCMRIFTMEGVEILDEEFIYIRDGDRLYVSRGEEFDSDRNFAEYDLQKALGEGGFGKVWLGRNTITNEMAAIKVMKLNKICGARDIDMVFREIESLRALKHPHIVQILNCYTLQNMQVVIIMEYLQGGELLRLLRKKGTFTQQTARMYFKQLISAVKYCHANNIIHRDLKLQNILMKDELTIKVADFGISGVADCVNPDIDTGTLKYMAPQILNGRQKSNSPAVDVWACGIILFYMLCGSLPFTGTSSPQIIQSIVSAKLVFPKHTPLSAPCKALLSQLLEADPKLRAKMSEVEDSEWVNNNCEVTVLEEDKVVEAPVQRRTQVRIPSMMIPKRLEKEKCKIIEELEAMGRVYKSENKYIYGSQELPALHLRGSRGRIQDRNQFVRKKRNYPPLNMWK